MTLELVEYSKLSKTWEIALKKVFVMFSQLLCLIRNINEEKLDPK